MVSSNETAGDAGARAGGGAEAAMTPQDIPLVITATQSLRRVLYSISAAILHLLNTQLFPAFVRLTRLRKSRNSKMLDISTFQ